ncbi:peptidoglycan-associated lipoprotein Pal [Pseudodesulfovibrio senegalensis]|jgi:peptidoglycan-associated lipoprotein|uniref:Peptidoglycan-associated lipoprotein n=1 Tax=Pseudodesulfovibrio senegalensis TaxID=1721087 RepID=A0A6N6N6Q2_9BACT|nr:peptidoglycan-associated lipoprotein Pal [Pseudodesulfovibrio senegalensis]KAB1443706.1 peptidoglycan-associated lipoprotein Pal [Pseudodesulfovibrio senegalensis]
MKIRFCLATIALLGLVAFVGAGCSKKSTSSMPPGATQVKVEDKSTYEEPAPAPVEPQVDERALAAEAKAQAVEELAFTINFAFDSYELNDDARATLGRKAALMKTYRDLTMVIEGYCDERGTEEYNLALGERRARAAFEHMVILGVAPERMSVVSFGEERPVDPGHNEAAWAKNRRDEFKISQ